MHKNSSYISRGEELVYCMDDKNNDIPCYDKESEISSSILLLDTKKCNFFVEDLGKEHIYQCIFKNVIKDFNNRFNVITKGGKNNVKLTYKDFKENPHNYKDCPCIFLVDLDFDEINSTDKIVDSNFIYLERYSIENYLIDEEAIATFISAQKNTDFDTSKKMLNYNFWFNNISSQLNDFFILFIVVQKYCNSLKNINNFSTKLINNDTGFVVDDIKTIYNHYYEIVNEEVDDLLFKINEIKDSLKKLYNGNRLIYICGKFYIKSLQLYLSNKNNNICIQINEKLLINNLCLTINKEPLMYINTIVEAYLSKYNFDAS